MTRLVLVTVPEEKKERIMETLDDEGVDYRVTEEVTGDRGHEFILFVPLPVAAVETVLERLREAGLREDEYTIIIDVETIISENFEELEDRYTEESDETIASDELKASARDLMPSFSIYVLMTVVSAMIATAGLLLDSASIVVGSMVIAPFIGPAMASSVGTVFRENDLFRKGVKLQIQGLVIAVLGAAAIALLVKQANLIPPGIEIRALSQVRERLRPDFLSLAVALGSGVAGVVSLATGISSAIVGVMIAVALIPPAATVGIGIAWGLPDVVIGSGVLLLVNVFSINLAALIVLWYMGYRPDKWFWVKETKKKTVRRVGVLVLGLLLLSVFLGTVTYSSYQTATVEQSIDGVVRETLDSQDYTGYTVLDTDYDYSQSLFFESPSRVTLTIGVPPGSNQTDLAELLDNRIDANAGKNVGVQIRYIEVRQVE